MKCHPPSQAFHTGLGGQGQGAAQSANAGSAHQDAQATGAAMQNLVGENRHEDGVGHADQAHQANQDEQRANDFCLVRPSGSLR